MKAVSIDKLSLAYDREEVLSEISFEVEAGDFFTIIGPNGTGKTTLLKAMARVAGRYQGAIALFGRDLRDYSVAELARNVAVVPQQMPLDFPFTVEETVLMGRSPHLGLLGLEGQSDYELCRQAMEFTDVTHLSSRRLDQLSGGERQRVIIARAICQQPRVILLDEPTASLDPAHQIRLMDLMERLRRESGVTVIMVSHDLNLAGLYGKRLLLLNRGRVEKIGTPHEVLAEATLAKTYGCAMLVDRHPAGPPRVTLVPGGNKE